MLITRAMLTEPVAIGSELREGERVGAWRVEGVRARLPHVVVQRARHVVTGRAAALQLWRPRAELATGPALAMIRRELARLNQLRHAHVAEILETGALDDGRPYLVVEWVDGRSLQTLLDEAGPLSLDEALPIVDEIAAALTAAHALGVVHGELHARNVGLVARGGHRAVKLVNFGMARLSGTRLAPEQARADVALERLDRRVDVFAFGALVYQMLTGVRPLAEPTPPSAFADVPHAFDEIVLRALASDPARRWDSVEAMMAALRAVVSGSELVAELYVSAYLDPAVDDIDADALEDAERALLLAQRWLERQKVALVLGGAGAVVATARIPRALEQQRAARAGWVRLAATVQKRMEARLKPHPAVRTRVQIKIEA